MITEDYCSFEVAKLLKEKGFNYQGFDYIDFEGEVIKQDRPTHQMAMKWLREVHNIHIQIMLDGWALGSHSGFYILLMRMDNDFELLNPLDDEVFFETYEEAVEVALRYTLENLI